MKMNRLFLSLVIAASWLGASPQAQAEPYPLEYWALRDVMSNVEVSPNGKYLGLVKIPNRDGSPVL